MNVLDKLTVRARLYLGFGILVLLTLVLGLSTLWSVQRLTSEAERIGGDALVGVDSARRLADLVTRHRLRTFELILPSSTAAKDTARTRQREIEEAFDRLWTSYTQKPAQGREVELREKIPAAWERFRQQAAQVDEVVQAELLEEATDMAIGDARASYEALRELLDQLSEAASQRAAQTVSDARDVGARMQSFLVVELVLILVVAVALAYLVARSVVRAVHATVASIRAMAEGRLDGQIELSRSDEIGQINRDLASMQATLRAFAAAQTEMAARHEAGEIQARMPADRFNGAYRAIAEAVNELIASQLATMDQVVGLMKRYAIGDLSEDMPQLPGEKAAITEAMRQTKASLIQVNDEIQRLVSAAAEGDFSVRGDADRFRFAFADMVKGLNRLMQQAEEGLQEVDRILTALADGDLTRRADNRFKGAFQRLVDNANRTAEQLTTIARKIAQASEEINVAAAEIAAGNADLSARTEQQAASLEETASSMEELTSTVKQNAENSRQARQLAVGAAEVAARGGEVVGKVVTTMDAISASSKRIEDIISVIDGIAFQTNILALNAAVEAARAGEQGRGFAVVASEVRSLAQRSADAAKEIKELIAESVITVGEGSTLVQDAGRTMNEIVQSVQRVTDIMSEIAAASDEQSAGIEQVNQTIVHMDEATQQNAALVEEASAAARSMEDQARQLAEAVAVFKLAEEQRPVRRTPPKPDASIPPAANTQGTRTAADTKSTAPQPDRGKTQVRLSQPSAPARRAAAAVKPAADAARRPAPASSKPATPAQASGDEHHWEEF